MLQFPFSDPSQLLLFVLEVVLKGSLVLAAAGLATSLLRKSPAAVRHTIWTTALAMVVVLPVIVAYTPKMDVGVLPADESQVAALPVQADAQRIDERATRAKNRSVASKLRRDSARSRATTHSHPRRHESRPVRPSIADAPLVIAKPTAPAPNAGFDWRLGLLAIWATGVLLIFFRYVIGWIALMRIKKRSEPVADVRFRLAAIKVSRSMGLSRRVRFVWGDSGGMPLTWGWIKPTVLLPQDAREWEAEKILSVLRHELAHIKRYDCFVQALVYVVCTVYWFNPLVWVAAAGSRREREMACDDHVLTSGTEGAAYADHLLDIARSLRTTRMSGASTIAMARPSELEGRLMAILSSDRHRGANTKTGMFATMGVLAAVAIPLAALRPVPVESPPSSVARAAAEVRVVPRVESVSKKQRRRDDAAIAVEVPPVKTPDVSVDLAPILSMETEAYLAQVNAIVEQATKTLESIERLEPTAADWQAEFGDTYGDLSPLILGRVIANPDTIPLAQIRRLKAAGVDVEYIEDLADAGLDRLTVDQLVSLAHANVDGDYVRAMRAAGYDNVDADELMQLGFANVEPHDIAVWAEMGYDLSTGELIRLAHADVDAEFVTAMATLGYKNLGPDELMRMSHADVDPEFVAEMGRAGYRNLTADEMIRLGHADIDAEFIREMSELGLSGLSVEDLIRLGHADVDADFILSMRSAGYTDLSSDDLIRMAHADLDPDFVRELAGAGYTNLTPDDLIRLGHADVDASFMDEMKQAGLKHLSVEDLVRLSNAEVDAEFVTELRDLGFEVDDVNEIVRLKYMEIDPEYIKRVRKALDEE